MRSLGSGGSADLNVMVSELKDMRESAKGFMNAQNSGNPKIFLHKAAFDFIKSLYNHACTSYEKKDFCLLIHVYNTVGYMINAAHIVI